MKIFFNTFKIWLPVAAALSVVFSVIYLAVQQSQRSAANDPQIQLAEDAAGLLAANQPVDSLLPNQKVDIAQSLALYWIIFDANGAPQASNASLHGSIPMVPSGVFSPSAKKAKIASATSRNRACAARWWSLRSTAAKAGSFWLAVRCAKWNSANPTPA